MLARLLAFLVWALLAGVAVFWGLRLWSRPMPLPPQAVPAQNQPAARGDLSRLLGSAAAEAPVAQAPVDGRIRLVGLVAPRQADRHAEEGVAVISVDGAPPRPVRVGGVVDGELRLLALDRQSAALGSSPGVVSLRLNLSAPAPAATGSLPPAQNLPPPGLPVQNPGQAPQSPQSPVMPGAAAGLPGLVSGQSGPGMQAQPGEMPAPGAPARDAATR